MSSEPRESRADGRTGRGKNTPNARIEKVQRSRAKPGASAFGFPAGAARRSRTISGTARSRPERFSGVSELWTARTVLLNADFNPRAA